MISAGFLALAVAQAVQAPAPVIEDPEIVVVASRPGQCRVRLADRTLSNRQLAAHAARWAREGRPLRVVRPRGADYRCMAKIAFRLNDLGVRLIHFVEPGEQP